MVTNGIAHVVMTYRKFRTTISVIGTTHGFGITTARESSGQKFATSLITLANCFMIGAKKSFVVIKGVIFLSKEKNKR